MRVALTGAILRFATVLVATGRRRALETLKDTHTGTQSAPQKTTWFLTVTRCNYPAEAILSQHAPLRNMHAPTDPESNRNLVVPGGTCDPPHPGQTETPQAVSCRCA
mmetsp:Transcript_35822/g.63981  ORF Transcript_35822/g.63981 Transcript_35822/m.63981 type:complete len:107 (-) Transcript_35822:185-505(-)